MDHYICFSVVNGIALQLLSYFIAKNLLAISTLKIPISSGLNQSCIVAATEAWFLGQETGPLSSGLSI